MQSDILINVTAGETRVAILEKGQFVEFHIERAVSRSVVGSVIMGRVNRVLPGMQAAFVDIGLEKAAFLYVGDYLDESGSGANGEDEPPRNRRRGRNGNGRASQKIEELLEEGQEIVVQVAKEPIGSKGARINSHISIAGRHLVLTPWARRIGVSRRIDSDRERRRLREILDRLRPRDLGFIIRTAGEGIREADLEADVRYLTSVWDEIQVRKGEVRAPAALYEELDLPLRVIRDFSTSETRRIVVDSAEVYERMKDFVDRFMADPKPRIERHEAARPLFSEWGIEDVVDANLGRKVWLKSGGHLIVDQSEALTAIDVNTGRYVGKRDLEETVLKTNLEAVKEIVQQLRFRNIGGLIIMDLIDMESLENREKVYRALQDALRQDKAKSNILKISELGLVEMTRKRTRENLVQTLCEPCSYCEGRGYLLSRESVAYKVLRAVRRDLPSFSGKRIAVTVNRRVAEHLLGVERASLEALEREFGRSIEVRARAELHQEQFEIESLDEAAEVDLSIPWLSDRAEPEPSPAPPPEPAEERAATEQGANGNEAAAADEPARPEAEEPGSRDPEGMIETFTLEELAGEEEPQEPLPAEGGDPAPRGETVDAQAESPILPPPKATTKSEES